jgi:hypothetical protein
MSSFSFAALKAIFHLLCKSLMNRANLMKMKMTLKGCCFIRMGFCSLLCPLLIAATYVKEIMVQFNWLAGWLAGRAGRLYNYNY